MQVLDLLLLPLLRVLGLHEVDVLLPRDLLPRDLLPRDLLPRVLLP